ncbi:MAG TPA: hypothetical protein VMD05_06830 [Candidatus Nanoarchaeia archaeon]|nr:hypothetical protein [Candidatus Nanoarchaeia archaeon]
MIRKTFRNNALMILILVFSFVYRVSLMLRETFPPGADIGLHNSIIHSIMHPGHIDFLYNAYHMGGGSSVTFPGYHIFTAYVILLTNLPDYIAQAVVVSFFSTFIVAVAFLLTRKAWNISAALIVAFLVAVSRFDIEMLMWGGYPNVITLMLIPLAFYLFLEKGRFGALPFLVSASLISGAIFLTHSLSAVIFVAVTVVTVFFSVIFAGKMRERRIGFLMWILPLIFGAISIVPFLIQVAPAYLGADVSTFTGGLADIKLALLATKIVPLGVVVPLLVFAFLYFLFSKYYSGKFLTVPTILFVVWWLVPTVLTQGYLIGLYTDFTRFLYFVILPVILLIGVGFYHVARFFSQAVDFLLGIVKDLPQVRTRNSKTLHRVLPHISQKLTVLVFTLIIVLYSFFTIPIFATPSEGVGVQTFYQLMDRPGFQAIQWAQNNTIPSAVFLTDAEYGWWFSGFAQRPTISAVDPQYLTNAREVEPAKVARYVLDTDYLIDNGFIQVREDGGYIGRHNPEFLAKLSGQDQYFPYPFFNFDNSQINIEFRAGSTIPEVFTCALSNMSVIDMHMENENNQTVSIYVTRQNQYFNFTQQLTITQGVQFVNMTETIASIDPTVTFDHVIFTMPTKGQFIEDGGSSVAQIDKYYNVQGQIIFTQGTPEARNVSSYGQGPLELDYNLGAKNAVQLALSVGLYEFKPAKGLTLQSSDSDWMTFGRTLMTDYEANYTKSVSNPMPMDVFNYQEGLASQNVSYVAVRDSEQLPRFAKDPMFSLVFINNEVAIFKVHTPT